MKQNINKLNNKMGAILMKYFNVAILLDWDLKLPYKSSPIEGGKDYFEKLLRERLLYIRNLKFRLKGMIFDDKRTTKVNRRKP